MRCTRNQVAECTRTTSAVVLAVAAVLGLGSGLAAIVNGASNAEQGERLVLVDTDAGPDDALAILQLLAAENESLLTRTRILAVTCVTGNAGVQNVTRNVMATLHAANRLDVPVYAGAEASLLPPHPSFSGYFGQDGFGDFIPSSTSFGTVQAEHAAVALVRLAKEHPGELTLLCIGPLTNIALAVILDSSFLDNMKEIFILGGAVHGNGNARPGAEFNVFMDPEAAMVVFEAANKPLHVLPWETALDSAIPMDWRLNTLGALTSPEVQLLNQAERKTLSDATWISSDALLAASLIDSRVIASRPESFVSVLTGPGAGHGVTLVDYSNTLQRPANAIILEKPDVPAFKQLLLRLMSRGSGAREQPASSGSLWSRAKL